MFLRNVLDMKIRSLSFDPKRKPVILDVKDDEGRAFRVVAMYALTWAR